MPWLNDFKEASLISSISSTRVFLRSLSSNEDLQLGQEWKNRVVRTSYDPMTGSMLTERLDKEEEDAGNDVRGEVKDSDDEGVKFSKGESKRSWSSENKANFSSGEILGNTSSSIGKKKGKSKVSFVCSDCGHSESQWWGTCRACNTVGTLTRFVEDDFGGYGRRKRGFEVSENAVKSWLPQKAGEAQPMRLADVTRGMNQSDWRIPL